MAEFKVTVAPNGARRQKRDHSELPVTPQELAVTAQRCQAEGASGLHLHVRDAAGQHSLDAGRYRAAMAAVAEAAPGMAIQITTESAGIYEPEAQLACLKALHPAAASIAVRELARDPNIAARAYALCAEVGTEVQHILYGPSCIAQLASWYDTGVVPGAARDAILVLGKYVPPVAGDPDRLVPLVKEARALDLSWSLCAFGRTEQACLLEAIKAGGNVRIGFENNTETPEGLPLADNAASVAALVKAATKAGHSLQRD
ncbi:3-keto-5-aminohexanoate cleavage protein [Pseudophaeobacter sp.]|uniref:3-keto-5-aminohexanoate cleavage protein n=1 Tax=Pseudophaeobacter sp. TaxID=1971739 RepID=UPI0032970A96